MAMGFRGPGVLQSLAGMQQPQMPAIMQNLQQPMPVPEPEQKKPGLFGQGGKGWMGLGLIGDALQSMDGGRGTYMPAMLDMREQAAREKARLDQVRAQAEAKAQDRVNARNDWVWQQEWHRENPAPTEFQRNYDWLAGTNPQAAASYMSRQTNDVTWRQGPDGQWYPIQNPTTLSRPVGKLTPLTEGGAGGNASGSFQY